VYWHELGFHRRPVVVVVVDWSLHWCRFVLGWSRALIGQYDDAEKEEGDSGDVQSEAVGKADITVVASTVEGAELDHVVDVHELPADDADHDAN